MLIRIIIAAVLIVVFSLLPAEGYLRFVLFMIPYLVIGYDILKKAFKGILNKQVFDENFLMAVATVGAILLGDYSEGVAVMLFYQIGELFQSACPECIKIVHVFFLLKKFLYLHHIRNPVLFYYNSVCDTGNRISLVEAYL